MSEEKRNHVHGIAGWRRAVLWPLCTLLKLWGRTLRFEVSEADQALLRPTENPRIIVLWHNRLFAAAEIFRRFLGNRRVYCLVSASKDGAWLSAFFEMVGMLTVRGSSSNLGREALHGLADCLRSGEQVGITPDGPRGPVYKLKGGGVILARKTGVPSLLLGINFDNAWRIRSWDRFYLPKPWSTVRVTCVWRTAAQLRESDDPVAEMEAAMIELNPDAEIASGFATDSKIPVV